MGQDKKTQGRTVKVTVDNLMTLTLLFLMGYQIWGEAAHEWAGALMLLLFLAHYILNRSWYKGLFRGSYTFRRVLLTCVDMLLLVVMLAQMYSGIVMSRHVFAFLPIESGMALARKLHILGAYWGFLLVSVHLGLHWNMFISMAKKKAGTEKPSRARAAVLFLSGLLIAVYGVYVFVNRDFATYLFLRTEFVFLDYQEPAWSFYLDHICVMGLCIFLAHYIFKKKNAFRKRDSHS